jgi:hypothetical protein
VALGTVFDAYMHCLNVVPSILGKFVMSYDFSFDYGLTCSVCGIDWDIYTVSFRKMSYGHQEDVHFRGVEKYFCFFHALNQAGCISLRYVLYVNNFTRFLSAVVRRFISVHISLACLDKIFLNL